MIVKEFNVFSFRCFVREVSVFGIPHHYCGYVEIPDGHPMHKRYHDWRELDNNNISVHGGVTWQGFPNWSDVEGYGWLVGFDCKHSGDRQIGGEPEMMPWGEYDQEWTKEAVTAETEKLAMQLHEMWR